MGETQPDERLSNAPGGRPAGRLAARLLVKRFLADGRGTTAVEYSVIIALIFVVIVSSMTVFGNKTTNVMNRVSNAIGSAIGP